MAGSMAKDSTVEDLTAQGLVAGKSMAEGLVTVKLRAQRLRKQDLVVAEEQPGQVTPWDLRRCRSRRKPPRPSAAPRSGR
jgi:hypothetical protein